MALRDQARLAAGIVNIYKLSEQFSQLREINPPPSAVEQPVISPGFTAGPEGSRKLPPTLKTICSLFSTVIAKRNNSRL